MTIHEKFVLSSAVCWIRMAKENLERVIKKMQSDSVDIPVSLNSNYNKLVEICKELKEFEL
jgi:hypothetical protein